MTTPDSIQNDPVKLVKPRHSHSRPLPASVEKVDPMKVNPELVAMMREAREKGRWPIYLHGKPGCGKSMTAASQYLFWTEKAVWWRASDLVRTIMDCRRSSDGFIEFLRHGVIVDICEIRIMQDVDDCGLLVIDDLGTRMTEAQSQALLDILDARAGRPMTITGNFIPGELAERMDERIVSRVLAGTVIHVKDESRRQGVAFNA